MQNHWHDRDASGDWDDWGHWDDKENRAVYGDWDGLGDMTGISQDYCDDLNYQEYNVLRKTRMTGMTQDDWDNYR